MVTLRKKDAKNRTVTIWRRRQQEGGKWGGPATAPVGGGGETNPFVGG